MLFSSYEAILDFGRTRRSNTKADAWRIAAVGACAGGVSVMFHDLVMVPAETVKVIHVACPRKSIN